MVINEKITIGKKNLIKTYSDLNVYIHKIGTNEKYSIAYDLPNMTYKYEETDIPIQQNNRLQELINNRLNK